MLPWGKVYSNVAYITRAKQTNSELLALLESRFKEEEALELTMTIGIQLIAKRKQQGILLSFEKVF